MPVRRRFTEKTYKPSVAYKKETEAVSKPQKYEQPYDPQSFECSLDTETMFRKVIDRLRLLDDVGVKLTEEIGMLYDLMKRAESSFEAIGELQDEIESLERDNEERLTFEEWAQDFVREKNISYREAAHDPLLRRLFDVLN